MCRDCQASFHERFNPPTRAGACDACGGELYQREDDKREVVENRVNVYLQQTVPVVDYYACHGVLKRIDGDRGIDRVREDLLRAAGLKSLAGASTSVAEPVR